MKEAVNSKRWQKNSRREIKTRINNTKSEPVVMDGSEIWKLTHELSTSSWNRFLKIEKRSKRGNCGRHRRTTFQILKARCQLETDYKMTFCLATENSNLL